MKDRQNDLPRRIKKPKRLKNNLKKIFFRPKFPPLHIEVRGILRTHNDLPHASWLD